MDNQIENAVMNAQAQAQAAGEQSFAAAKGFGDNLRAVMEKSLHETRARYAKTKSALDEATAALEASVSKAQEGVKQFNAKALETLKADAEANFDFTAAAVSAKTFSELMTLNTEFVRKRFEDATARAKAFSEFARHVAEESAAPIREQAGKALKFS